LRHNYNFNLTEIITDLNKKSPREGDFILSQIILKIPSEHWEKNTSKYIDMNTADTKTLGLILKHQLITEKYVNDLLEYMYPNCPYTEEILKQRFAKKIEILSNIFVKDTALMKIINGIGELNKIRNKYAHNLDYKIKIDDIKKISIQMNYENVYANEDEILELIGKFVSIVGSTFPLYYGETHEAFKREFDIYMRENF
jgi:hypothetical protein